MYCTKPLHHRYAKKKERTLPISGISEQHGIFFEGKKTTKNPQNTTWYKSWLSPSRGDLNCFLPKQTRVRLDSASRSPVPHRDEWKTGDKVASPPSSTPSSGYEPPIKQKAENGRGQAPPHRPLVPLVSVILKQKQDKRTTVRNSKHSTRRSHYLGFASCLCCRRPTPIHSEHKT